MKRKPTPRGIIGSLLCLSSSIWPLGTPALVCFVALPIALSQSAGAATATPGSLVGDIVTNPTTNVDSEVVQLFTDANGLVASVLTADGDVIATQTTVGDLIQPAGGTLVYKVISVVTNATSGLVETVNVRLTTADPADPTSPISVVTGASAELQAAAAANAGSPGAPAVTPPTSTSGTVNTVYKGSGGSNGSNAYGVSIPTPWGNVTIAKTGSAGKAGATGPTNNQTFTLAGHGAISSTGANTPGILLGSIGGNGGKGGDSYGNIDGYAGGNGGNGGTVILNNGTSISTSGSKSHGIYAFSRSGKGGEGGTGYIFAGGGSGGGASNGGPVTVTNTGSIQTLGIESHGIYVLSVGGNAGDGGGSWGIVGSGGSGANGGNGGTAGVTNNGTIRTEGRGSHGILAQSVGGTGGNGGAAGGIVSFGGGASSGGVGGNVSITNQGNAEIVTLGATSVGVFGQSIGGSGGDSGAAGGIVSLGGSGGSGNNAGSVTITNLAGSRITTGGNDSHGVFGQSVGGGGGNSSPTGGVVSIGGSSSGGGNGGIININSAAIISTGGKNAHGIFAQSIGGGGGSAGGSGGLVSLGGSGGAGGNGSAVSITNSAPGAIRTTGIGSHAIFGQSIGGGGGAGADSGGLVSIGGKGSGGGSGGTVTIQNGGFLGTMEKDARGIFAQSIGGGGGSGGGSGGLVSLGGGGSTGSSAGAVSVTNLSTGGILTAGTGADAIFAQSIGGGGGAGAASGGLVALGGSGSGGGSGGSVIVTNGGNLQTSGDIARGIFAQSVGGGGGSGGSTGGLVAIGGSGSNTSNGGNVTVANTGGILTSGDKSTAIFAQSVGGGGGDGGTSGGVITLGGSGGAGGASGNVSVSHGGQIFTSGDDAFGIFSQAVGGGGGNGGGAYSGSLFAGFALGGSGSSGGNGGLSTVTLNDFNLSGNVVPSIISTTGDRSTGILAQSVGGGGGNGGNAIQGTVGVGVSISVAIGGKAGNGGIGGAVLLNGRGNVITSGMNSGGIVLQSVGGGGGNGGTTVAGSASIGDGLAASVAIGGSGGKGGKGGTVSANVESQIQTDGLFSTGFLAQSVGGGGGNGGTTIAASAAGGAVGAGAASVAVGSSGGDGGDGDHVDVTLRGTVLTKQAQSDGIVIQSVGGGGGNGGLTIAAGAAGAGVGAGQVTVGVGGSGGLGGDAGRVDASITNDVETLGDGSEGIIIQSVGGGGGNSGLTISGGGSGAGVGAGGINLGVGGSGGVGGNGDIVDASYDGMLVTRGDNSTGLLVQSVGGGGGNAGGTIVASLNGAGVGAGSIAVGIGGSGGVGGDGGNVSFDNAVTLATTGSVSTFGNNSGGIVAQSVGGGGGNGGFTISAGLSGAGVGSGAVNVSLGGKGGAGGDGKGVTVTLESMIWTEGADSSGVLVQSVGGGGGNGGFNISAAGSGAGVGSGGVSVGLGGNGGAGGLGGKINASSTGTITTLGDRSAGFIAQSIGGGGGNGGFNIAGSGSGAGVGSGAISVGLGGNGGIGNHAGSVIASTSGDIRTRGASSSGILAQSVGGGGGNGGFNIAASGSGAGVGSGAVSVGLGGSGGAAGNGDSVNLTVANDVITEGVQSLGIIAQSVGGGGGNGGFNASAQGSGAGVGSGALGVGLGGSGGSGGNGGNVTAGITGDVISLGDFSGGILAQSVGGGGGNGGLNIGASGSGAGVGSGAVSVGIGGAGALGGNAGSVNLMTLGNVGTAGILSRGVVAQSIGGGGGNGGMTIDLAGSGAGVGSGAVTVGIGGSGGAGGVSGRVDSLVTGDITTEKSFSDGFVAQTIGGGGGNGALAISGAGSGAGVGSGAVSVGVGGSGGTGGDANIVTAAYSGILNTSGDHSIGMLVQAVGGGGGNGGGAISAGGSGAGVGSGTVSVGVGGSGGSAGVGGLATVDKAVTASADGFITTLGDFSSGFIAQSIGGGGGNGGYSISANGSGAGTGSGAVGVGIGGSGAGGGDGKGVETTVSSFISTLGNNSVGMLSQSIGGGGGNGGFNVTAVGSGAGVGSGGVSVGLGGSGSGGGNAGFVTATSTGEIATTGDRSGGFIAQSIGGGGGNGGFNVSASGSGAGTGSGTVGVGLGGSGAGGGDGGAVVASTVASIFTEGDSSGGILAQSVGGGGGNGAFNVTATGSGAGTGSGAVGVGLGGSGAGGGNGSTVGLTVTNQVKTLGKNSAGIIAQSVGGGGGNGGFDVTVAGSGAGTGSGAAAVSLGGSAGTGGDGGDVTSSVIGNIFTSGDQSAGLIAQSLGGGGGNGGFSVNAAISGAGTGSGTAAVGLGGSGGGGGNAGKVVSVHNGNIVTNGDVSTGVIAQSLGGGGGNGGFNVTASLSAAKTGSGAAAVGIGGSGGDGGDSDTVDNTVIGDIATNGLYSGGVLAQSLGGGGGNGGMNISGVITLAGDGTGAVGFGLGGSGGDGGSSAMVTNSFTGNIITLGKFGSGVVAQSIGGGGGNGGMNVTGAIGAAKTGAGALAVGIGGMGGGGGAAADVHNSVLGRIDTSGDFATGVLAQSVGGGGGNGGLNISATVTAAKTGSGGLAFGLGGFGGDGGNGANVINNFTGGVVTRGDSAPAIVGQSLGGGGGNGGINVSAAVNLTKEDGGALGIGIGGFGGNGGNAGNVTSTVATTAAHPNIITLGDNSAGVTAQSLGGGGGNGGLNVTAAVNLTGKNGAAVGVGVGGFGGGGGNAGDVLLGVTGPVTTFGNGSDGLSAQSIGGGGGNGGTNITGALAITTASGGSGKTLAASIGVGGFGGLGGNAGNVGVTYSGTIDAQPRVWVPEFTDPMTGAVTPGHYAPEEGEGSNGIAAQSIGGGGGNGGINVSGGIAYASGKGDAYGLVIGVGGFGGAGGDAGNVSVDVTGGETISSYGEGKSAILAQSLGGGGGNGGINVSGGIVSDSPFIFGVGGFGADAGVAKNVDVTAAVDLNTFTRRNPDEQPGAGILAQSLGGGGGNGALNVSGGLAISKEATVPSVTFGIGGFGGAGAISGDVTVDHAGDIASDGAWVHGIMAQSIAGGGGNGGMNVSGQINFADSQNSGGKTDLTIIAGVGGSGGKGANAGDVSVIQNGVVTTKYDNARGVAAQSIGGGGGNGGMNVTGVFAKNSSPISVGVGGTGGGGGHAGSAFVTRGSLGASTGKISTNGKNSTGIEASSIGGGGGNAGMNFVAGVSLAGKDDTDAGFTAQFAIGGSGGDAGNGGAAGVTNFSDIVTLQGSSHGILAQSIGGGGGNGNFNLAVTYAGATSGKKKPNKTLGFNLAVGGAPGDGGDGSTVDVSQTGNIETRGDRSYGILAQSIGGGGGNVGLDVAFSKQDGGKAGITIGRIGGTGGVGKDVTLRSIGDILTHGDGSFGMLAQSVGNGGGNSSAVTVAVESAGSDEKPATSATVSVGLEGGQGGRAGNVTVDVAGSVTTKGQKSHAIFAQSVGGGGGNGGMANSFGPVGAPTASLSLGGTGGSGGVSGVVDVTSSAQVRTSGGESVGILAQSVGGGGGTGGMAVTGGSLSKVNNINVAVGGSGGSGMASDRVQVSNSGIIITSGEDSHGVLAQSLGGGGGNSGMTINSIAKDSAKDAKSRVAISVGGNGGSGATSGDVSVSNTGGIGTNSANSIGIFAQSIGGGGGNADNVISTTVSGDSGGNNLIVGIGGTGGTGAAAGDVSVSNQPGVGNLSGQVITLGNFSHGIAAMSVGGGGGTGSTTYAVKRSGKATGSSATNSAAFALGGAGGSGGTGGDVNVTNGGKVTTYGYKAHGILAQSVGGGGGSGGMAVSGDLALGKKSGDTDPSKAGSLSIGGFGGAGNISGDVTVTNSGSIEVFGKNAYGVYAQSVGGGGGDGGFAAALSRNILSNPKTNLAKSLMNIAVGGIGGTGADSGDVLVNHTGSITAHGDDAYGIFAQSVGGGGGNAGHSISSPVWTAADLAFSTILGAVNGSGGTAGKVTIHADGDITMLGKNSTAYFGQSVNGGGGNVDLFLDVSKRAVALGDDGIELPNNGGDVDKVKAFITSTIGLGTGFIADAAGSAIDATHVGDLYTSGKNSVASLVQSIGGGGGNANSEVVVNTEATVDLELALGGSSSSNNSGGDVSLTRTGDVVVTGNRSQGTGAQSIGGGGGNLSVNVNRVPIPNEAKALAAAVATPPPSATGSISFGADAGLTSNGGNMALSYTGNVTTSGKGAYGTLVQSIGGGGGKASLTGLDTLAIALGGTSGTSGNGGRIDLSNDGSIHTIRRLSHGIILQSIGGGGGAAFTDLDADQISLSLNADNRGDGGNISFKQNGDIQAEGKGSIGVIAQSLGGGGGIVDRAFADTAGGAGISGSVSLMLNGNVYASGKKGNAVLAQSRAADGQADINVKLTANNTIFSGKKGEGVHISGGADNRFTNQGTIITADMLNGDTAIGEDGNESIVNRGTFYGQFDLGSGKNSFDNKKGGLFVAGPELMLGAAGNTLINSGLLVPGDVGFAQRSSLTGSFTQNRKGVTYSELDFASDLLDGIDMTGSALLNGEVVVDLLNKQAIRSGDFQKSLFHGNAGVTDDGMTLTTTPSVVVTYDLTYPTGFDAMLDYTVDFSPAGMSRNLREVGDYFNRIQNVGSSAALADTVITLVDIPDMDAYRFALSQLGPDIYGEQQAEMIRSAQRFGDTLMDGGQFRFFDQGKMLWFDYINTSNQHEAHGDYKTTRQDTDSASFGFQQTFDTVWTAGLGFGYESVRANGYDGRWRSEGDAAAIGAMIKRDFGATEVLGTLSYGWNNIDTTRTGQVTTPFEAHSERDLQALAAMFRISHEFLKNDAYIRPTLDLGITHLMAGSATETGGGPTDLVLKSETETHIWTDPNVRFGKVYHIGDGIRMDLHAGVGYQYYLSGDDTTIRAGFTGAPAGAGAMDVPIDLGSYFHASVGVELINSKNVSFGIDYAKVIDDDYDIDAVSLRLNIPF